MQTDTGAKKNGKAETEEGIGGKTLVEEARIVETLKGSGERKFRRKIRAEKLKVRWMEAQVERLEKARGTKTHFSEKVAILEKAMKQQKAICAALNTAAVQAKALFGNTSEKADGFTIMYFEALTKYAELCKKQRQNMLEALGYILEANRKGRVDEE